MLRFTDIAGIGSNWEAFMRLAFEPISLKILSAGGTFRMHFMGGKAVAPFTNVHGVSLLDVGSGRWSLTMSRAPIRYFDRSVRASDAASLAAAVAEVDWDKSRSTMFLYPSCHESPAAISTLRLPNLLFQVSVG